MNLTAKSEEVGSIRNQNKSLCDKQDYFVLYLYLIMSSLYRFCFVWDKTAIQHKMCDFIISIFDTDRISFIAFSLK